ncbi:beta-glucosidase [Phycicoccus sp. Soil803]|nr:family 1 glycosylhydrolase [Phycicoccus sp. Soil803]KRF26598.1 beta-glucosidase [Phycicoccus sp. Soil803]
MSPASPLRFPEDFLWGAATAGHQTEGNNTNSDWWARETRGDPAIADRSGDACDSYHRYPEDMRLLADAGLNSYRFSLEWCRIQPEPDYFSRAEIDHYRRMVDTCHEHGLNPVVTLHHFTIPQWLAAEGGWRHPDAADLFARFTEAILPVVSEGVHWVCTINEPNMIASSTRQDATGLLGNLPQSDPQVSDVLVEVHKRARDVLSSVPRIRSGWAIATQAVQAEPGGEVLAHSYSYAIEDFFLEAARGDDWVGVQAYTRTVIGPNGPRPVPQDSETTLTGWEYYPSALGYGIRNAWDLTRGVPILVTENGIATADDTRRIAYTHGALTALHQALDEGITVRGYLHWSALDNYEWGSYRPTFGLIAVDRNTFIRTAKPSLRWLGDTAKANALAR